jgi:hypothetical protein
MKIDQISYRSGADRTTVLPIIRCLTNPALSGFPWRYIRDNGSLGDFKDGSNGSTDDYG